VPDPALAQLAVPDPFRHAFLAVEQLDEEAAGRLIAGFQSVAGFQQVADLQRAIQEVFPPDRHAEAERLVPALLSLLGQLRGTPAQRIAEAVSQSADLDLDEPGRTRLCERLVPLLSSGALSSTASAVELLTQNPRNFSRARVLTDIRPIFSENVEDPPEGAVIVQTLHLDTWDRDGDRDTYHVTMDEADLQELRVAIDRAITKTATLRELLSSTGLTLFELDERGL
jgi:hypothetical protein